MSKALEIRCLQRPGQVEPKGPWWHPATGRVARRLGVGLLLRLLLPLPAAAEEAPRVLLRQAPARTAPTVPPTRHHLGHPLCPPWLPLGLTAESAMGLAEACTGGVAISAREIPLNGATGGFEVYLEMPRGDRGWRVVIDRDTGGVRGRTPLPNPGRTAEAPPDPFLEPEPPVPRPSAVAPRPQPAPRPGSAGRPLYRWVDAGGRAWITSAPPPPGSRLLD